MRLTARLRIALAAGALALGLTTACLTPSVPLPPPLVENMTFQTTATAGEVVLQSPPEPSVGLARFSIWNASKQVGVLFESAADGSFTSPPFLGSDGDYIEVVYEKTSGSASRCTALHVTGAPIGYASDCH
jgi:hypothetical protein